MSEVYSRQKAIEYAKEWAFKRNKQYYAFDKLGGDCTNFISQCIYAGSLIMNYKPVYGWYYSNLNNRSPAWSGVEFLYNFLISNTGPGPIGEETNINDISPGDIIQLRFAGRKRFSHSLLIVDIKNPVMEENILISTHDRDRFNYQLSNYIYEDLRFVKIQKVNKY